MSSESKELFASNNSFIDAIELPAGASLLDILNQHTFPMPTEQNTTMTALSERIHEIKSSNLNENSKISTVFVPTGRERNATGPLKQWLYEHQDNPYPTESEKEEFMKKTNMSAAQITIWFTNARVKMRKEKLLRSSSYTRKSKKEQNPNNPNTIEALLQSPIVM